MVLKDILHETYVLYFKCGLPQSLLSSLGSFLRLITVITWEDYSWIGKFTPSKVGILFISAPTKYLKSSYHADKI